MARAKDRLLGDLWRGILALVVLDVLRGGPLHGYGVRKAIIARTGWAPPESSLYDALRRLERMGLVESYWARRHGGALRKMYRLAPGAVEVLEEACRVLGRLASGLGCGGGVGGGGS